MDECIAGYGPHRPRSVGAMTSHSAPVRFPRSSTSEASFPSGIAKSVPYKQGAAAPASQHPPAVTSYRAWHEGTGGGVIIDQPTGGTPPPTAQGPHSASKISSILQLAASQVEAALPQAALASSIPSALQQFVNTAPASNINVPPPGSPRLLDVVAPVAGSGGSLVSVTSCCGGPVVFEGVGGQDHSNYYEPPPVTSGSPPPWLCRARRHPAREGGSDELIDRSCRHLRELPAPRYWYSERHYERA